MWQLTISLFFLLAAIVVAILLVARYLSQLATETIHGTTQALSEAIQTILKPVVDPEPIQQTETAQEEMFSDPNPPWQTGWDGSPTPD